MRSIPDDLDPAVVADAYPSPWLPRDVIETPLDRVYDVNGWDLRKAVDLMVRGNATVCEWLRSPIVYSGTSEFRDLLLDLAAEVSEPALIARHYAHVGQLQWERLVDPDRGAAVPLKRIFHSLRPAAALRWMRCHPGHAVPPMRLQTLLEESDTPVRVVDAVAELPSRPDAESNHRGRGLPYRHHPIHGLEPSHVWVTATSPSRPSSTSTADARSSWSG